MPRRYEKIRDRLRRDGKSLSEARTMAARIFNATRRRGQRPVTRGSD